MSHKTIPKAIALFTFVAALGIFIYAGTGTTRPGSGNCLNGAIQAEIGHGATASGTRWYVVSYLKNDDNCRSRMLEVVFHPSDHRKVSWSLAYAVPVGGSLSGSFIVASEQMRVGAENVYAGITSKRAASVEVQTYAGTWIRLRPKVPDAQPLPQWLRNVRYFIYFGPASERVKQIRVRDNSNCVIYQGTESVLGQFDEVGVL